jgi:hypothetical protein
MSRKQFFKGQAVFLVDKDTGDPYNADIPSNIGTASGVSAAANFMPAAAAYSAGDVMDTAKQFLFTDKDGVAVPANSLLRLLTAVMKIDETAVPSGQTSYALQLYNVTPPSAQADNDAWTLASVDLPGYVGSIQLGTPADLGEVLYVKLQYIDFDIRLVGSSLYGRLVTNGAFTSAAVARQVRLHGVPL